MKALQKILELTERENDPENDPYDARRVLQKEIKEAFLVDFFFGSAMDVADSAAQRRAAQAINQLREKVQFFSEQFEKDAKKVDDQIYKALKGSDK